MHVNITLQSVMEGIERDELLKLIAVQYALENDCEIAEDDVDFEDFDGLTDDADDLLIAIQNTLANVDREFDIEHEEEVAEDYDDYEDDYEDEDYDDDCEDSDNRTAALEALRNQGFDISGLED